MAMMRIRGVWTTNLAAFLLGAGMYSSFIVLPQFAQLPKRTGFGFGASVVVSSLYLLPVGADAWACWEPPPAGSPAIRLEARARRRHRGHGRGLRVRGAWPTAIRTTC